jgi:sec-independent protein translocase protein TatB
MGTPLPIEAANIGMADSLILMVMALVVFGPRKLPQLGRQVGKLMYEFRKASNEFKFQMEEELRSADEADRKRQEEARRQAAIGQPVQAESPFGQPQPESAGEAAAVEAAAAESAVAESKVPEPSVYDNLPASGGTESYGDYLQQQQGFTPPESALKVAEEATASTAAEAASTAKEATETTVHHG